MGSQIVACSSGKCIFTGQMVQIRETQCEKRPESVPQVGERDYHPITLGVQEVCPRGGP